MTSATVAAKTAASSGKPEKIRKDHNINWWLTAAVAVLSLTVLVPLRQARSPYRPPGNGITSPMHGTR